MNIKKVMHKDRHGAQVSVEFEQGQGANPKALGVLQEFFQAAIPQMGGVPEHPGEPKGTDTVPAWLTPGEFVMNAEATRMFEPQIEAMNDAGRAVQAAQGGSIPEYKNDGGYIKLPSLQRYLVGQIDNSIPPQEQLVDSALALGSTPEQLQAVLKQPIDVQTPTQGPNIPYGDEFLSDRELSEKLTAPYYEGILEPSNYVTRPATPEDRVPQVTQEPPPESGQFPLGEGPPVSPAAEFSITDMLNKAGDRATSRKAESLRRQKESIQDTLDKPDLPESTRTVLEERVEVLDTITPKEEPPVGNENKTDDVIKAGAKQVAMYDTDDILDMATSEEKTPEGKTPEVKAPEKEGFFKSVVTFLRDTLGDVFEGIIEPDELKKMALFYIGSRSFGNSHEGTLNWLGTRFIADMDRHQALVDKATASGKYTPESIETFSKSKNIGDLKEVGASGFMSTGTQQTFYLNGKPIQASEVTDPRTKQKAYMTSDGTMYSPSQLMTSGDYTKRIDEYQTSLQPQVEQYLTKVTGDDDDFSKSLKARLPTEDAITRSLADYAVANNVPYGMMNAVSDGVVEDMIADLRDNKKLTLNGQRAVMAYVTNNIIKAQAGDASLFVRKDDKGNISTKDMKNLQGDVGKLLTKQGYASDPVTIGTYFSRMAERYSQLPEEERAKYVNRANKNQNGFYQFVLQTVTQQRGEKPKGE